MSKSHTVVEESGPWESAGTDKVYPDELRAAVREKADRLMAIPKAAVVRPRGARDPDQAE